MATKPQMTTTQMKKTLLPLGSISKDKLVKAKEVFQDANTWQADNKYATLQAINKAPHFGFFLKNKDLFTAGWLGNTEVEGMVNQTIKFSGNGQEQGLLFQKPRMIIVDASPRLVEVTEAGADAYNKALEARDLGQQYNPTHLRLGLQHSLVDVYCDFDGSTTNAQTGRPYTGYSLHEEGRAEGLTSLRTFYLVFLLDDQNNFLHTSPLVLSLKGLAASQFGGALSQFAKAMMADVAESDESLRKLAVGKASLAGLRKLVFITHLEGAIDGANDNWITRPQRLDDGSYVIGGDILEDPATIETVETTAELNDGFAWKYSAQIAELCGWHQLGSNLVNALPEASNLDGIEVKSEEIPF